jgi:hypothetical protein
MLPIFSDYSVRTKRKYDEHAGILGTITDIMQGKCRSCEANDVIQMAESGSSDDIVLD